MKFKENRKLAYIVLIAMVIFSITVQGSFALLNCRGDTEVLFMEGEMHSLMNRCAEQAALIGQMSAMYLSEDAFTAYASAETASVLKSDGYAELPAQLERLSAQLADAADPNECIATLTELTAAVEKAYTGLDMLRIADEDFRNIKLAYYDYKGAIDIVSRDGEDKHSYTAHARDFNHDIAAFPGNLFAAALGVEELSTYGG